ncbi:MAG: polysaccharide deacetylase family protein [Proteobacteria bacterium]|nr:polysaccharide deacetylase family protein [Pseudomonadota bacterium]
MRSSLTLMLAAGMLALAAMPAIADSAVIVMYHRFGEDSYPGTNVRIDQFEAHIKELAEGPYTVLPVSEIVSALRSGKKLPDRTVGITVDDAYLSVYTEAWPRLKAAGLPFTLFVATDAVDKGYAGMVDWDQIREMRDAGVEIAAHTASHLHMADAPDKVNRAEMQQSLKRLQEELGARPALFAYPYGEASLATQANVKEFGFETAFGQHSGVAHGAGNPMYLPRFALNETYSALEDFILRVNTLPLPVSDVSPLDSFIRDKNPPLVGFTVDASIGSLRGLACYHSQFGKADLEILGTHRVEIRFPGPFGAGRSRLNCTKPAGKGRWRWFGMQYYTPS